jgi:hypothetical protein
MDLSNIIKVARQEVGYIESKGNKTKYGEWFGLNGVPWCGIFVSWCYAMGGNKLPKIGFRRGFAGCQTAAEYFKAHNMIVNSPISGDIVLYDWKGDGRYDHTGIFLKRITNNTFAAIEGNTSTVNQSNGGSVMVRTRNYKNCIFIHVS